MATDLYIMASPLQALNAIEARAVFPAEDAIAVLIESVSSGSNAQLRSIVASESWKEIRTVKVRDGRFRKCYVNVAETLARLSGVAIGRMFIGFYDDIFLHFAHSLAYDELFLLDDGIATISLNDSRIRNSNSTLPVPAWKQLARRCVLRITN